MDIVVGWRLCFVDEAPLSFLFEILNLSAGDCRSDESRKPQPYFKNLSWRTGVWIRLLGTICWRNLKEGNMALIAKRMPEAEPNRPLCNCF